MDRAADARARSARKRSRAAARDACSRRSRSTRRTAQLAEQLLAQLAPRGHRRRARSARIAHRLPAPEDIARCPRARAGPRRGGPRPGFEDAVWFRMNVGRRHNADPRWLLPLICRCGHVGRERDRRDPHRRQRKLFRSHRARRAGLHQGAEPSDHRARGRRHGHRASRAARRSGCSLRAARRKDRHGPSASVAAKGGRKPAR